MSMSLCFRVPLNFPQGDDAVGATPIVYPFMSIAEFHENTIYTTEFGNGVVVDRDFMATIAGVSDVETATTTTTTTTMHVGVLNTVIPQDNADVFLL